jgi:hypothetical protein
MQTASDLLGIDLSTLLARIADRRAGEVEPPPPPQEQVDAAV